MFSDLHYNISIFLIAVEITETGKKIHDEIVCAGKISHVLLFEKNFDSFGFRILFRFAKKRRRNIDRGNIGISPFCKSDGMPTRSASKIENRHVFRNVRRTFDEIERLRSLRAIAMPVKSKVMLIREPIFIPAAIHHTASLPSSALAS